MKTHHQAFINQVKPPYLPVYVFLGPDPFLMEEGYQKLRSCYEKSFDAEYKRLDMDNTSDWDEIIELSQQRSLFAEHILMDIHWSKKTFDKKAKDTILAYLDGHTADCLLMIRANQVAIKSIHWLTNHQKAMVVTASPLKVTEMSAWVQQKLKANHMTYDKDIIPLIVQHSQGNMAACSQMIERMLITYQNTTHMTVKLLAEQLVDDSTFQVYEWTDALLKGLTRQALIIFRRMTQQPGEESLLLWCLLNEIRQLQLLQSMRSNAQTLSNACDELKIWKQKMPYYQMAVQRVRPERLESLHQHGLQVDEWIKTGKSDLAKQGLEQMTLSFCLGES